MVQQKLKFNLVIISKVTVYVSKNKIKLDILIIVSVVELLMKDNGLIILQVLRILLGNNLSILKMEILEEEIDLFLIPQHLKEEKNMWEVKMMTIVVEFVHVFHQKVKSLQQGLLIGQNNIKIIKISIYRKQIIMLLLRSSRMKLRNRWIENHLFIHRNNCLR